MDYISVCNADFSFRACKAGPGIFDRISLAVIDYRTDNQKAMIIG
jgi:hypothetical protein